MRGATVALVAWTGCSSYRTAIVANGLAGLVFASVHLATRRNLYAAIAAHGVVDTTGFVMMYFDVYPGLEEFAESYSRGG